MNKDFSPGGLGYKLSPRTVVVDFFISQILE
jgi:hypothetical protein